MQLSIEYIPIEKLTPYENNTRQHNNYDVSQIAESIKKYGFDDPVGIWGENNLIVEGHGRILACEELGITEVPCIRLDHLSDKERREYAIAHNKTAELSNWDFDSLTKELEDLDFSDFDFGFELPKEDAEIVEDEAPEVDESKEPKAKLGDIYQLGRHRLMCGDSTNIEYMKKLMNGVQADLLLTDPPYNIGYNGKTKEKLTIQNDKMEDDRFREFLRVVFLNAKEVLKPGAAYYIWHGESGGYNFRGALMEAGFKLRQTLIWVKNSATLGRQDYQWKHEPCLYGWNDGASHSWYSDRKQSTILCFDRPQKNIEHPTMKPVSLFDYQIKNSTKAGDIVLDPFGGAGTTIMACEQNERSGYLMELDPRYVDVIIKRWEDFTGEKAILIENLNIAVATGRGKDDECLKK